MDRDGAFDLVLSDWRMAEMNGLELLNAIKAKFPTTIVILMTAYGTIQNAVAAMKAGAYDYVTKPFSLDQIQHAVERALEVKELRTANRALRNSIDDVPLLTTGSHEFRSLIETAHAAASSDATILRHILDAANDVGAAPSEVEMDADTTRFAMQPLFVLSLIHI